MTAGFVPIRLDAPSLLGRPSGRREGHWLSALGLAVDLAEEADFQTHRIEHFSVMRFARRERMTWRRVRRALEYLKASGIAGAEIKPFRAGVAWVTPRTAPGSLIHDQSRPGELFVPLPRGALREIAKEHNLSWVAEALLFALLCVCHHRTGRLPGGWTKTRLMEEFGVGWRRLSAALEQLEAAGLIAYSVRRGGPMHLEHLARSALVEPTLTSPRKRRDRRQLRREAERGRGEAVEVAAELLRHFGLAGQPSAALVTAIAGALETGASRRDVLERCVARGNLAGATDPIAVLVGRARAVREELLAAREASEWLREARAAEQRRREELEAAEAEEARRAAEEDRWIASVLESVPSAKDLGLRGLLGRVPMIVAAHIREQVRSLITRFPDLDPAALANRWAKHPCAPEALDTTGIAARAVDIHGPPGTVPRAREGPSLTERLRNQKA